MILQYKKIKNWQKFDCYPHLTFKTDWSISYLTTLLIKDTRPFSFLSRINTTHYKPFPLSSSHVSAVLHRQSSMEKNTLFIHIWMINILIACVSPNLLNFRWKILINIKMKNMDCLSVWVKQNIRQQFNWFSFSRKSGKKYCFSFKSFITFILFAG